MKELHTMICRVNLALILFASWFAGGLQAYAHSAPALSGAEARMTRRVVLLTNEIRVRYGLSPLQLHPALMRSARWMARDMVQHNYLRHTDYLGREIDPRLPAFGYGDYAEIGENIAGGQVTAEQVVFDWMRSPGHRSNLLNPAFREIGVAHVIGAHTHFKHYWVQDFGVQSDTFPVVINNKAPETANPLVHLYLYGKGWAQQMRFSNDGVHWSSWEPYESRCVWTLNLGYGSRTVYAEVRGEGITRSSKDTVRLLASPRSSLIAGAVTLSASP